MQPISLEPPKVTHPLAATSLGLAIVLASNTPLLLLDGGFMVRAASASFCRMFGLDPKSVAGQALFRVGQGEWNIPHLRWLLNATLSANATIEAYELDLPVGGEIHNLVLNAQRLVYGQTDPTGADPAGSDGDESGVAVIDRIGREDQRLLLAVLDVTAARLDKRRTDDLLREKQVLLQELQHRVANSLQIIANVLMQSVRKVQSEEARVHLNDAHHRVMSIATLQRQLAQATEGNVVLRTYFTDLCRSIGASMISDQQRITITPTIDNSVVNSDQALSLGLIVTELVINALKHAFPVHENTGRIEVNYAAHGEDWTLTVGDDGVGMPANARSGLGTGIIEALAGKLDATVKAGPAAPGTRVTIEHLAGVIPATQAAVEKCMTVH